MGIRGLATYIANRSEIYFEPFELHDTFLVIDGNNLSHQLYIFYSKSNCAFGGDYDRYKQCVKDFFKDLQRCNIIPLVLLDGGIEEKKMQTSLNRTEDKLQVAASFTPSSQDKLIYFPLLLGTLFKSILKEMSIRHVQCFFEADHDIAMIAKLLDCPVLSFDSDFYIYGSLYIPFNTMDAHVIKKERRYVKCCKIFRIQNLLDSFNGMDISVLPLAAVLIGNDYVEQGMFKDFYNHIKIPKVDNLNYNLQQCHIDAIFTWLSRHTLSSAIPNIMENIPRKSRKGLLKIIKMVVSQYTKASVDALNLLSFIGLTDKDIRVDINKFQMDHIEIVKQLSEIKLNNDKNEDVDEYKSENNYSMINTFPAWFVKEYQEGFYPSYMIDSIHHNIYISYQQIEDYCQPSSIFITIKILNAIFTLLTSGLKDKDKPMVLITRGKHNTLARYSLEYIDNVFPCKVPSLQNLRDLDLIIRREILNATLDVKQQHVIEFPIKWRLYIATVKYWVNHLPVLRNDCHIYALLFSMLHHVIDTKIGFYRSTYLFQQKYKHKLETLETKRKEQPISFSYSADMIIYAALESVDRDDCLLAAPYFISNCEMNQQLLTNPKQFNVSIVHIFSQFQQCLRHITDLNQLLGKPYVVSNMFEMFNGTLLYNLYATFNKRKNIEDYIHTILQHSPTLLQLFYTILNRVKLMFKISAVNGRKEKQSLSLS